jgi:hypothetical protein
VACVKENSGSAAFQRAGEVEVRGDGDAGEALIDDLLDAVTLPLEDADDSGPGVGCGEVTESEGLL